MTRTLGYDEIKRVLPHRHPMLLVDRVVELEPGVRLTARKAVSGNELWCRDLADDLPAAGYGYPPTLLVESWCQAAGVLAACGSPNPDVLTGRVMLVGAMTGIRFFGRVLPGDVVEHRVRLVRSIGDTAIFEGESLVDGQVVLAVERSVVAMRPAAELAGAAEPAASR